jgi:ubiquinone biosynthesis protein UbiJ
VGAAITPWSLLATPVGFVRWVKTIREDSAQENQQAALRRELAKLAHDVAEVEAKFAALKKRLEC